MCVFVNLVMLSLPLIFSPLCCAASVVKNKPALRQLLLEGDFFLACGLAATLTKLALRFSELEVPAPAINKVRGQKKK